MDSWGDDEENSIETRCETSAAACVAQEHNNECMKKGYLITFSYA